MVSKGAVMLVAAVAGLAALGSWMLLRPAPAIGKMAYYYDESAERLFVSRANQLAPIPGTDGPEADGVLAVVYTCGTTTDEELQIAYLQRLDDELKAKWEAWLATEGAEGQGPPEVEDRVYVSAHTLVRRPGEGEWYAKSSREGQAIVRVLTEKCANGAYPRLCDPKD